MKRFEKFLVERALDMVGREDDDINNDGEVNGTDRYLRKRRRAIGKAMGKRRSTMNCAESIMPDETYEPYKPDMISAQEIRRKMQQARGEIRKKYGRPETRKPGEIDTGLKLRFKRYKRDNPVAEAAKPETPRQRDYYRKLARREAGEPEPREKLLPRTVDDLKTRLRKFKTERQAGREPKY